MHKMASLLIVSLLMSCPLMAQDRQIDPHKAENIRRLLHLVGAEKIQANLADQFAESLKSMFASMPQDDPRARQILDRMAALIVEEFRKVDFMAIHAELYDKYFTAEEIEGLVQFYQTPLGRKSADVLPAVSQESFMRGKQQGELAASRAMVRLAAEYPELRDILETLPR